MNKQNFIITFFLLLFPCLACGNNLEESISRLIAGKKAQVGVAVILNGTDTVTINNDIHYPLMSVVKFHQALSVANFLHENKISPDSLIFISGETMRQNTYSPLRDAHPQGNIGISVKELLTYTLQLSDNIACDVLFSFIGGTRYTDKYIRSLGFEQFAVTQTENDMHRDINACYRNWSTPLEAARLLDVFISRTLPYPEMQTFIKRTMIACETGTDRLAKPLLGKQCIVGHKTGTGDRNSSGKLTGINDIGFVLLPDGRRYTIAVFIKDSEENEADTAQLIADISETVYRFINRPR